MKNSNVASSLLRDFADKIDEGSCSLNKNELDLLVSTFMHVELKKSEAAELLGISTRTFDRKVSNGELPQGIHEMHHKDLIWYKDEILNYKERGE